MIIIVSRHGGGHVQARSRIRLGIWLVKRQDEEFRVGRWLGGDIIRVLRFNVRWRMDLSKVAFTAMRG